MFIHEEECKVDGYHGKVEAVSDQHVTDVIVDNLSKNPRDVTDDDCNDKDHAFSFGGFGCKAFVD